MTSLHDNAAPMPGGYRDVSVSQLAAGLPPGVRLVDVREPAEFTGLLGHIQGAELVPLATVPTVAERWPRDAEVLLVCRSGGRSAKAAAQLAERGFTRVMNLRGGMLAWNLSLRPVVRRAETPVPTLEQVREQLVTRLRELAGPGSVREPPDASRESLTAFLQHLSASPPPVSNPTALEQLLRETHDWLAVARPEGRGRT